MFEVGSAVARVKADISNFQQGMDQAKTEANGLGSTMTKIGAGIEDFGKKAAIFTGIAAAGVAFFAKQSVEAYNESQLALAQQEAVLKSTHGAAGVHIEDLQKEAQALQKLTRYSDEAVASGQNILLTFTNIKGGTFKQATDVILDMSTALGQDLQSSAIQVGKALQDPILGVSALRRVGVNFTEAQQEVIKKLVETGHAAEAQQLILKELNTEFGGSAQAAGQTFAGKLDILKNKFNDLQEKVGKLIVDGITPLVDVLTRFADSQTAVAILDTLTGIFAQMQPILAQLGEWIAQNQEMVITFFQGVAIAVGALLVIGAVTALITAAMNPFTLFIIAITALYMAWQTNFFGMRDITTAVFQQIQMVWENILKPVIDAIRDYITANWDIIVERTTAIWNIITGVIQVAWAVIYGILSVGIALLKGDWQGALDHLLEATNIGFDGLKRIFAGVVDAIKSWGGEVLNWMVKPFVDAWNKIQELANKIKDAMDPNKRHSPSLVDRVKTGVEDLNRAWDNLDIPLPKVSHAPEMNIGGMMGAGAGLNSTTVMVSLDGAFIGDESAARRMAEIVGNNIVKKLQLNVRL